MPRAGSIVLVECGAGLARHCPEGCQRWTGRDSNPQPRLWRPSIAGPSRSTRHDSFGGEKPVSEGTARAMPFTLTVLQSQRFEPKI